MMYFCLYVSCTETCGIKKTQISHISFPCFSPSKNEFKEILNSAAKIDCHMMVRSGIQREILNLKLCGQLRSPTLAT